MKNKVIKLSNASLRKLIREAIESKQFGSPEPFQVSDHEPELERKLDLGNVMFAIDEAIYLALTNQFDENDPVMAEYGYKEWVNQVRSAIDEVMPEIEDSLNKIVSTAESKLHSGVYAGR